jgi:hypothetical protein
MLVGVTPAGITLTNRAIGAVETVDADFFERLGKAASAFHDGLGMLARPPVPPDKAD